MHLDGKAAEHAQFLGQRVEPRMESEIAILIQRFARTRGYWQDLNLERKQLLRSGHAGPQPEDVRLENDRVVIAVYSRVLNGQFHSITLQSMLFEKTFLVHGGQDFIEPDGCEASGAVG
jgi:hypothetical protein